MLSYPNIYFVSRIPLKRASEMLIELSCWMASAMPLTYTRVICLYAYCLF